MSSSDIELMTEMAMHLVQDVDDDLQTMGAAGSAVDWGLP
jgi:hypothetical protein